MATTPPETAAPAAAAPAAAAEPAPTVQTEPVATEEEPPALGVEADDDVGDFSLADLAGLDVSQIEEIRSEQLPAMAGVFKGKSAKLDEQDNRDGEKRYVAIVTFEVVEVHTVIDKGVTPADVLGKTHTERFWIVPEKAHEGIGRIRAFVSDVGLNSAGALGGVEGCPPGILDSLVDHIFPAKILVRKVNGEPFARLRLPPRKKN